jgi:5-methylcytosine-specific restriction enzyme subunit McrC
MLKSLIQIREYGTIAEGKRLQQDSPDFREIDTTTFSNLIRFIEEQSSKSDFEHAFIIYRKSGRRHIRVKNYVGVIETSTGTTLEILPKLFNDTGGINIAKSKAIFLRMLKALYESPYIRVGSAHLETIDNFPIFEFFIQNYLAELEYATRGGLTSSYITQEKNSTFLRGKLLVTENIKYNSFSHNRFFCQFDEFSTNTPFNKILKTTLRHLMLRTRSSANKRRLLNLMSHFENTEFSINIIDDFERCNKDLRIRSKFQKILEWSEVFLTGKSFGNFIGSVSNFSMLFPMEKLFENYICHLIKKYCSGISIKAQDRRFSLVGQKATIGDINFSTKLFNLRPDIVLNDNLAILDTKWKILNENVKKFNISEADVYQMHAYGRRYQQSNPINIPPRLGLIYPMNPNFNKDLLQMRFGSDMYLDVIPIDLSINPAIEISRVVNKFLTNLSAEIA